MLTVETGKLLNAEIAEIQARSHGPSGACCASQGLERRPVGVGWTWRLAPRTR